MGWGDGMMGEQLPAQGGGHRGFDLLEVIQKRTVIFRGMLRQGKEVQMSHQGRGHCLLPPLMSAANPGSRTGDIWPRPRPLPRSTSSPNSTQPRQIPFPSSKTWLRRRRKYQAYVHSRRSGGVRRDRADCRFCSGSHANRLGRHRADAGFRRWKGIETVYMLGVAKVKCAVNILLDIDRVVAATLPD